MRSHSIFAVLLLSCSIWLADATTMPHSLLDVSIAINSDSQPNPHVTGGEHICALPTMTNRIVGVSPANDYSHCREIELARIAQLQATLQGIEQRLNPGRTCSGLDVVHSAINCLIRSTELRSRLQKDFTQREYGMKLWNVNSVAHDQQLLHRWRSSAIGIFVRLVEKSLVKLEQITDINNEDIKEKCRDLYQTYSAKIEILKEKISSFATSTEEMLEEHHDICIESKVLLFNTVKQENDEIETKKNEFFEDIVKAIASELNEVSYFRLINEMRDISNSAGQLFSQYTHQKRELNRQSEIELKIWVKIHEEIQKLFFPSSLFELDKDTSLNTERLKELLQEHNNAIQTLNGLESLFVHNFDSQFTKLQTSYQQCEDYMNYYQNLFVLYEYRDLLKQVAMNKQSENLTLKLIHELFPFYKSKITEIDGQIKKFEKLDENLGNRAANALIAIQHAHNLPKTQP